MAKSVYYLVTSSRTRVDHFVYELWGSHDEARITRRPTVRKLVNQISKRGLYPRVKRVTTITESLDPKSF